MATKIAATAVFLLVMIAMSHAKRDLLAVLSDSMADRSQILKLHNTYRKKHLVGPLKWSSTLASGAAKWAANCKYEHNPPPNTGENLAVFLGYPPNVTYRKSASSWYAEGKLYNYEDPGAVPFHEIGHFTQMVWKSTSQLGCGRALCSGETSPFSVKADWVYVVCRYKAAGNVMNGGGDQWSFFKTNVLRPTTKRMFKMDI